MNIFMEVSALLTEAQRINHVAHKTADYADRYSYYKMKASRISAAVLRDPGGWYLDGYEIGHELLSITYRGCWWFHIKIEELPEAVSAILFDRNVTWLKREDGNAGKPEEENWRNSWPIPDPDQYFRSGYHSMSQEYRLK